MYSSPARSRAPSSLDGLGEAVQRGKDKVVVSEVHTNLTNQLWTIIALVFLLPHFTQIFLNRIIKTAFPLEIKTSSFSPRPI